ncbi:Na(+)-translocating NADH-quinone reductase subunit C [Pluralibacter gergoviae]|uniref:Na(+)-translocating NADH-quinone reductase subunit C n=1 Tax=Pluralibacter gergoviae TaxID=61647 RepID=A0AAW8HUR2_PLUGE|nr:Na(+)-translocating NADH-quinone reductase subunit C [Pluralibacter gergoviae]AVR02971.1 NADH:ubiquinone reductase (Na(+)-transporting) subunit C [Pluralibacter gergoviae]KMK01555.1 Na(+)-translocating NADH-quinone reductase subunit C [Pluralibacter gergoviae]KMK28538.1 Na(+)-translocating NADH-quinone reductase subunit C [Pluralibacter gergoviae]MCK1068698.1 Na(+)-translocating NADH-quinone reductase subunit C [Pluralibacter gergoviae]MCV7761378.1 Na(+)-translocating NADH-quinone reductase
MAEVKNNDSFGRTLLVVLVLCLVCSIVVAGAAVGLKPRQQEQRALDKQRNILAVAGLSQPGMKADDVASVFAERITPRLLDLNSGTLLDKDPGSFNQAQALKDPGQSTTLDPADDPAGIKRRSNVVEIWLVKDAQQKLQEIVLPIYGNGLWSMMYAFVALDTDGRTVKGITYYDQGETPGLGGEVENPAWRQQFVGKKVLNDSGMPALKVVKGGARPGDEYAVDGLSGATLTSNGVQHSFDFWMGEQGFGPFLKQVREGGLNNG